MARQIRPGQLQENVLYNISASYAISASHEIVKEVSSSYADFAESASYAVTASYLDSYVEPFPFVGDAVITGSLTLSGSGSPLLSLPDAPQDAAIISGSSGTTSVYIYDSVDGNRIPTYDKGAGLRLVSGEGTGQATLDVSAVGSDNGGSNNEQAFIRCNQTLTVQGEGNAAGDNIRFRGSFGYVALDSTTAGTSLTFVTNGGSTPSTIALGSFAGSAGIQITANASNTYLRFIQGSNTWLDLTSTKATFIADVSSSATSTSSFGTYLGDGSQLTGIDTGSWDGQYSGSAVITGSLVIEENSTTEALRVTQTGTGDAIRIEDSSNPDATPTVITKDGDMFIGSGSAPQSGGGNSPKLYIKNGSSGYTGGLAIDTAMLFEGNGATYFATLAPDSTNSGLYFGSPSDIFGGFIRWGYDSGELRIGAASPNHKVTFTVGNKSQTSMQLIPVGGTGVPTAQLNVTGSIVVSGSTPLTAIGVSEGAGSDTVAMYNTSSGEIFYTSSAAIGGGGSGTGFPFSGSAIITGSLLISSSTNQQLTLIGSGSDQPIFRVQGSAGELFSITDNLSGSLFAVNNISGLPILEVFSDDRIIQGDYAAPMLTTTVKNTVSSAGAFTVYELPTASYDGAFFEYTARSGSNARAGQIMSIWSGSQVNFTETTTTDFGSTTGLAFTMIVTGSNFALTGSVTTADWTIKTIVRSI